jgi:hypothetical protein
LAGGWVGLRTGIDWLYAIGGTLDRRVGRPENWCRCSGGRERVRVCCRNQNEIILVYGQSLTSPVCPSINMTELRRASAAVRTETGNNLMKNITSWN